MNIRNTPARGPAAEGNLLGRVRRAHDHELEASEVDEPAEASAAGGSTLDEAAEALKEQAADGLERQLIGCARSLLDEKFDSPGQVRRAVVDAIVDARYDALVSGEDREAMIEALEATLTDDPSFRAEVEDMLIHAARKLGRAEGG